MKGMSVGMSRNTVKTFLKMKENNNKITMLTAYDYCMAKLLDEAGINCLLVGDSLGMVVLGYDSTLQVTVDDIVHHSKAVARGSKNALIVADMPFLSYHISVEKTVKNAGRLIQEGNAHAVKLEGGSEIVDKVAALVRAQIPVMGHIGLTPQSVNMFGGYKIQGRNEKEAQKLIDDALALEKAGVFSLVLEAIPSGLAEIITNRLKIPTIGIGAGNQCDGQVLVIDDLLGMFTDFTPSFVKVYLDLGREISRGVSRYIKEVKSGEFPDEDHSFSTDEEMLARLKSVNNA